MWPGCGLLTDVPTSGVGQSLLHFPIHRKNAISSLGAADPLFALFSLERFNSPLSYSRHQLWESMTPFSIWLYSALQWQDGKSQLNFSNMDTKTQSYTWTLLKVTVTNEKGVYIQRIISEVSRAETCAHSCSFSASIYFMFNLLK